MYQAILLDPNYSVDLNSCEDLGKHFQLLKIIGKVFQLFIYNGFILTQVGS